MDLRTAGLPCGSPSSAEPLVGTVYDGRASTAGVFSLKQNTGEAVAQRNPLPTWPQRRNYHVQAARQPDLGTVPPAILAALSVHISIP
jgi:hypothetical protein